MHPLVRPVLARRRGRDALVLDPKRIHHTLIFESPWMLVVANGGPLSVRMARGSPYVRNAQPKTGHVVRVFVE